MSVAERERAIERHARCLYARYASAKVSMTVCLKIARVDAALAFRPVTLKPA